MKQIIHKWELSGIPKSIFCREQGLSYHKFNYWQKRLGKDVERGGSFTMVKVVDAVVAPDERIMVRGNSGLEVSIPMNKDAALLIRQLLQ